MNVLSSVRDYVNSALDFNAATLSGAIDVVCVRDLDANEPAIRCTPFHVRFGKLQVLKSKEKIVQIKVNQQFIPSVTMKLGAAGEAFFVHRVEEPAEEDYCTSPVFNSSPISMSADEDHFKSDAPSSQSNTENIVMEPLSLDDNTSGAKASPLKQPKVGPSWHDTYRVVVDETMQDTAKDNLNHSLAPNQSLISSDNSVDEHENDNESVESENADSFKGKDGTWHWGWDQLPIVKTSHEIANHTDTISGFKRDPSVYFDTIENDDTNGSPQNRSTQSLNHHEKPTMSLCGDLIGLAKTEEEAKKIFYDHRVEADEFLANPSFYLDNVNLLFMIDRKLYPYSVAGPYFIAAQLFDTKIDIGKILNEQNKNNGTYFNSGTNLSSLDYDEGSNCSEDYENEDDADLKKNSHSTSWFGWFRPGSEGSLDEEDGASTGSSHAYFSKSLRPTQEQLDAMNLKPGANEVEFVVHSSLQGERTVKSVIYLWSTLDKIVISDIDGTISKSNVLGHIMPMMGRDWSREGVAQFYSQISANGYKIIYLGSRPIGQSNVTKGFLNSIVQDDVSLPQGPVLLSPDRLMTTLSRKSNGSFEFKLAVLQGLKDLFPVDVNPFYAGFGNTRSDYLVYNQVGISKGKIFIFSPKNYEDIQSLVDKRFPPIHETTSQTDSDFGKTAIAIKTEVEYQSSKSNNENSRKVKALGDENFNEINFWKIPIDNSIGLE